MNFKVEEILMVIVAFLIGWFLRTMIKGVNNNNVNNNNVKKIGGKRRRAATADDTNYVNNFNNARPGWKIPKREKGEGCYGNPSNKVYSEYKTHYKQESDEVCHKQFTDLVSCQGLDTHGGECEWFQPGLPDCACKNRKYREDNNARGNRRCENYIEGDNNQPCAEKGAVPRDYLNMRGNMHECFTDNECSKDRVCDGKDYNYISKHMCVNK